MGKIKFRAGIRSLSNKIYWDYIELWTHGNGLAKMEQVFSKEYDTPWLQSIGLFDKNGKEIFKGDIIISRGNPDVLFLIDYGEDTDNISYGFILKSINLSSMNYPLNKEVEKYEVIGNKFENPELLKGGGS